MKIPNEFEMKIGGLIKNSWVDYPDKMACVIFTQGCNYRCFGCHNKELVIPEYYEQPIFHKYIFKFLKERQRQLEGVVISGGEPTIQKYLIPFIKKIKKLGYPIKLDTNGTHPEVLEKLYKSKLLSYVAMDIKGKGTFIDKKTNKSIKLIIKSKIDYQFRTTVVRPILKHENIIKLAKYLKELGANNYELQQCFIHSGVIDLDFFDNVTQYGLNDIREMQLEVDKIIKGV